MLLPQTTEKRQCGPTGSLLGKGRITRLLPPLQLQKRLPSLQRPPPRRRQRRRKLLFWDKETQISRENFEEQLQTGAHCWEYVSTAQVTLGNRGMQGWLD